MQNATLEGYRLSPQQRRVWSLLSRSPASDPHAQCAISISGCSQTSLLRRAVERLSRRHEVLRTEFERLPGMEFPIQVIATEPRVAWREVDLRGLDQGDKQGRRLGVMELMVEERRLAAKAEAEAEISIGVRACLGELSDEERVMVVSVSGMAADSRTMMNMVRELGECYAAEASDGEGDKSDDVVQYADYSEWQNELAEGAGEAAEDGRAYWREQGEDSEVRLPLERVAESEVKEGIAELEELEVEVTKEVAGAVARVAQQRGVSEEVVLLTCWQLLLWRLSRQSEIVTHNMFDGRKIKHLQGALGLFAKFLPVRCLIEADFSFFELLTFVEEIVSNTYTRQEYYPWKERERESTADGLRTPRLVGYEYQTWPAAHCAAGVGFSLVELSCCSEPFSLRLRLTRSHSSLRARFIYDPARYSPTAVAQLAEQFVTLVASACAEPGRRVSELDALGQGERRRLETQSRRQARAYPTTALVHTLFEGYAVETPDTVAVECGEEQLSFSELNAQANRLARMLRGVGVGRGQRVVLLLERSVWQVAGVLATWKAGAAYVPIDSWQPAGRVKGLVRAAGAAVVVTTRGVLERMRDEGEEAGQQWETRVLVVDEASAALEGESVEDLGQEVGGEELAYIIYTSGTSGVAKGVMVRHSSVLNLMWALEERVYERVGSEADMEAGVAAGAGLRVSLNAPLAFDASVKQVAQLGRGRTLVVIPEEVRRDAERLVAHLREKRVAVLDCTPSHLRALLEAGLEDAGEGAGELRAVLVGGEVIDEPLWRRLVAGRPLRYFNVYGPTECTVDATLQVVEAKAGRPSIGVPLGNIEIYLLDGRLRPAPTGVADELCIGGAGVARGYDGDARLTAERFVPDSFSGRAGARLYRTGDVGREREDGRAEYAGRADGQVKVRGHRVELGEVEAVLRESAWVREAAAAVVGEGALARLVAYVVPHREYAGDESVGSSRYELPNGMAIYHQSKSETDYLYSEIFEQQVYLRHGISLSDGACVFDIGANIGLFSLFVNALCHEARIYAFEPLAPIYQTARANMELYGGKVKLFNHGLSDHEQRVAFTYYPEHSAKSGQSAYADPENEVAVIKQYLENQQRSGVAEAGMLLTEVEDLVAGQFTGEQHDCKLRRLSDVIREEGVERIDLLKVDVQRAEMDVLQGLSNEDWKKIEQVVMEVHDAPGTASEGRVGKIRGLLEDRGYQVVTEQDELLKGTDRYNLYARRGESALLMSDKNDDRLQALTLGVPGITGQGQDLYRLPNRMEVFHQNRNETEHIYKQIFEDEVYLKHGIALEAGDCVFDVGANIGLFTLFVYQKCREAKVYAFEPIPSTFEKLHHNVARYGLQAQIFNCGLSDRAGTAPFTFYPKWSASSGINADVEEDKEALRIFLHNSGVQMEQDIEQLVEDRYEGEQVICQLQTLSEIISERGIERIDLLKIDVERSELDVLNGINNGDWHKIKQVVIEVHDIEGRIERITGMLERRGFEVVVEQDVFLTGTPIYTLYATRSGKDDRASNDSQSRGQSEAFAPLLPVLGAGRLSKGDLLSEELRKYLREKLPEYLVPASIVLLDELPLTRNGKVDRQALPTPKSVETDEAVAMPRTPVEEMLVGIWCETLKLKQVDIDESFFDLGGHSLLATQLMSRVRQAFALEMALRAMFERPTVRGLAELVEEALRAGHGVKIPALTRVERGGSSETPVGMPLSFAQQRLWFLDQLEPGSAFYNCPGAVRISGSLDIGALERTLSEVVRRHEVLRTRFEAVDGQPVQVVEEAEPFSLPLVDLRHLLETQRETEALRIAKEEAGLPFDLSLCPLMRATLLRLAEEQHVVLFTMHHVVSDAWSMGVLIREVVALYEAFSNNRPSPLLELPIQYADYAVWQRNWLQGEALEEQLGYWRQQLGGKLPVLEVPTDRPRPAAPLYGGAHYSFVLPDELSVALKALCRQSGTTLFMTLLAAFQTLLQRYTEQDEIVIGTDIANRNRVETENLIGFFINMLVMRVDLSDNPTFLQLLERVREIALGAYAHQDLPFDKLVEELQPERSLNHSPLFRVVLVVENTPEAVLELPGLTFSSLQFDFDVVRFDLTLMVSETAGSVRGYWGYSADLFDEATIEQIHKHFVTLLRSIVSNPEARLRDLEMLTNDEKQLQDFKKQQRTALNTGKFKTVKRKSINVPTV
jgi:amino acid adenylation domain-containing protein/FkbM family methyltransferase